MAVYLMLVQTFKISSNWTIKYYCWFLQNNSSFCKHLAIELFVNTLIAFLFQCFCNHYSEVFILYNIIYLHTCMPIQGAAGYIVTIVVVLYAHDRWAMLISTYVYASRVVYVPPLPTHTHTLLLKKKEKPGS